MRYIRISILLALTAILFSCSDRRKNDDIFSRFEGERGIYMIKLPPVLFMKLIGMEEESIDPDKLGNVDLVKLMIYSREDANADDVDDMLGSLKEEFRSYQYENLLGFNSGGAFMTVYMLENEEYVSDVMILFKESNSLACLGLSGKLNGKEIFKFATEIEYNKLKDFIDNKQ